MEKNNDFNATVSLKLLKQIIADLPDEMPALFFDLKRWETIKNTTTSMKIALGEKSFLSVTLDLTDKVESA